MSTPTQPVRSDQSGVNIKDFIFKYIRFLPLFIFSVVLSYTTAFLYLRYSTPIYRSSGNLMLKDNSSPGSSDPRFQQIFMDDRTKNIQNEIDYLKSRPLMERVVEGLGLNTSYYAKGKIKQENIYAAAPFRLEILNLKDSSGFKWTLHFVDGQHFTIGEEKRRIALGEQITREQGTFRLLKTSAGAPGEFYIVKWEPTANVAAQLIGNLAVAPKPGASSLILSIEGDNAQRNADVLNRLMEEYQRATIEDKNATTRQTLEFLDGRIRVVARELDSVTNRLLQFSSKNVDVIGAQEGNPYASKLDEAEGAIQEQQAQLYALNMIRDYVSDSRNAFNIVPSVLDVKDATLAGLIMAYNKTQLDRKGLIDAYVSPNNPKYQQQEELLSKLRGNILENLRNLTVAYNSNLGRLRMQSQGISSKMSALPAKLEDVAEIKRQQANKQAIYNFLMEKREEASISLAATISNIKILDRAMENNDPIKPNRSGVRSIALLIGILIPALFVFLLELLDDKILNRGDIEKSVNLPILGEIGHSASEQTLVVLPKSRSFVSEQFRIIRSNLQFVIGTIPNPVILVSSSFSGEGKSFVSTNLGAVFALAGKKTIILEFDIRKPRVLTGLELPKRPGFTNYMTGKADIADLPITVPGFDNLFVLACGPIPPNPAELLLEPKIDELFTYLKANFDIIVMDTAPVGIVSDALALSRFVDCSIYITRQGVTHKKQLELVADLAAEEKLPRTSLILNDIKIKTGYGYYYRYGRYGYGKKYGYGYGNGYYEDAQREPGFLARIFGTKNKKQKTNVS